MLKLKAVRKPSEEDHDDEENADVSLLENIEGAAEVLKQDYFKHDHAVKSPLTNKTNSGSVLKVSSKKAFG